MLRYLFLLVSGVAVPALHAAPVEWIVGHVSDLPVTARAVASSSDGISMAVALSGAIYSTVDGLNWSHEKVDGNYRLLDVTS